MYDKDMKKRQSERGNVLFYILIAVALIAALSFAVAQGGRSADSMSDERAQLYASEIIDYASTVGSAVAQLRLRGCSDTEISFENDVVSDYENTNAPDDGSCDVFHVNGGAVIYRNPDEDILDTTKSSNNAYGEYFFPDMIQVSSVGTDCSSSDCTELMMSFPNIKKTVCEAINSLLDIDTDLSVGESIVNDHYGNGRKFTGTYNFFSAGAGSILGDEDTAFARKNSGCFYRAWGAGDQPYVYYKVLIAR